MKSIPDFRIFKCVPLVLVALSLTAPTSLALPANSVLVEAEAAAEIEEPVQKIEFEKPPQGVDAVPGASSNAYLAIVQGAGNPPKVTTGKAVYKIAVPAKGVYTLWIRAYWDDSCGNSLGVQIGDTKEFMVEDTTYKTWHWVKSPPRLQQLALEPGEITLTIKNREDGVRWDQILLTPSKRYVPVAAE